MENIDNKPYSGQNESEGEFLNLADIWALVWNHKWWYVVSVVICIFFAAVYIYRTSPTYSRTANRYWPIPADQVAASGGVLTNVETSETKTVTGVFSGSYAENPLTGKRVPVWISEYVLAGYGTGAIMAVPAHDQRDYDFAKKFGIDIIQVIKGGDIEKEAYTGDGEMINSEFLNGYTNKKDSIEIIQKAYNNGINFYDTARFYTDSEEKLGASLNEVRENVIIATKTGAENAEDFWKDLETSLKNLQTDYVEIYQFHNLPFCPKPNDGSGLYEAMLEAKDEGKIKHIGITSHKFTIAKQALSSGLYETLQFPFSYLTDAQELNLVEKCKKLDVGFLAMKAMGGGLITNSKAAYAFMANYDNVLPIWGIQRESELDEFISYQENPPVLDDKLKTAIKKDKQELGDDFCRGCGYCMPCPNDIEINTCARMSLWIRRMPTQPSLSEDFQSKMKQAKKCDECRECIKKCPYSLNIPQLLKENIQDYENILNGKTIVD